MIIKPNELNSSIFSNKIWDYCIVGAGPAGITLALELDCLHANANILLVESGGLKKNAASQALSDLNSSTMNHASMNNAVSRQVGGTSNIWGGRCVPLDEFDFIQRAYLDHANWPISYKDLSIYYEKACAFLRCGSNEFDAKNIASLQKSSIIPNWKDGDVLSSTLERWSLPTNFRKVYLDDLKNSQQITLVTNLTCVNLSYNLNEKTVSKAVFKDKHLNIYKITSQYFILAGGGLESTRLLMSSNKNNYYSAGDFSGLLGKFYQGHISGKIANIRFTTDPEKTIYSFEKDENSIYVRRRFTVSKEKLLSSQMLNFAAWLDNPAISEPSHKNGILSFAYIMLKLPVIGNLLAVPAIRNKIIKNKGSVVLHIRNILFSIVDTVNFAMRFFVFRFLAKRKIPGFFTKSLANQYSLHYHAEHAPSLSSFVNLSDNMDKLGVYKLDVNLHYSDLDVDSVIKGHDLIDKWLRKNNYGKLIYHCNDLNKSIYEQASDGYHQIGTTRMSDNLKEGVVDSNCKVFGLKNLFICSSSVFPTSGQANPTFSIVALAIRVANFLSNHGKQ